MADRIKGITVEINGDTTGLSKALQGVNKEIRSTQAQLKDVNKLLKLDPGNTELISQKHRLLQQAVEETKKKLQSLKEAQKQADEALKNGTISQEQYDGLQREIAETTEKLKELEKQAEQSATAVQKIAAAGEKLKDVGGKVAGVGKDLTTYVTLPLAGGGEIICRGRQDHAAGQQDHGQHGGGSGDAERRHEGRRGELDLRDERCGKCDAELCKSGSGRGTVRFGAGACHEPGCR